jgi:hypothetical protein
MPPNPTTVPARQARRDRDGHTIAAHGFRQATFAWPQRPLVESGPAR